MSTYCLGDLTDKVSRNWFVPLTKIRENDVAKMILLKRWINFANYADWHGAYWHKRIEWFIIVPGGGTIKSSRMVTTLILWFASNVGRCFIYEAFKKSKGEMFVEGSFISSWAVHNSRKNNGTRTLETLFGTCPLPGVAYEVSERTIIWLVSEEGRVFLAEAYKEIGWEVTWEVHK